MKIRICVNQPGCLPDSEDYPTVVDTDNVNDLISLVIHEHNMSYPDWEPVPKDILTIAEECCQDIWHGRAEIYQDNLPSGNILTVERIS